MLLSRTLLWTALALAITYMPPCNCSTQTHVQRQWSPYKTPHDTRQELIVVLAVRLLHVGSRYLASAALLPLPQDKPQLVCQSDATNTLALIDQKVLNST